MAFLDMFVVVTNETKQNAYFVNFENLLIFVTHRAVNKCSTHESWSWDHDLGRHWFIHEMRQINIIQANEAQFDRFASIPSFASARKAPLNCRPYSRFVGKHVEIADDMVHVPLASLLLEVAHLHQKARDRTFAFDALDFRPRRVCCLFDSRPERIACGQGLQSRKCAISNWKKVHQF